MTTNLGPQWFGSASPYVPLGDTQQFVGGGPDKKGPQGGDPKRPEPPKDPRASLPPTQRGDYKIVLHLTRPLGVSLEEYNFIAAVADPQRGPFRVELLPSYSSPEGEVRYARYESPVYSLDLREAGVAMVSVRIEPMVSLPGRAYLPDRTSRLLTIADLAQEVPESRRSSGLGAINTWQKRVVQAGGSPQIFEFMTTYSIPSLPPDTRPCTGEYTVRLVVRESGGRVSLSQAMRRPPAASQMNPKWPGAKPEKEEDWDAQSLGSPRVSRSTSGEINYEWPAVKRPCGKYNVRINAPNGSALSIYEPTSVMVELTRQRKYATAEFTGSLDASGGGGAPPDQGKQKQGSSTDDPEAEDGYLDAGGGFEEPGVIGEATTGGSPRGSFTGDAGPVGSQLDSAGMASLDPRSMVAGDAMDTSRTTSRGERWPITLLGAFVDPAASEDAREAVNLHRIDGQHFVRGEFDGRRKPFVQGPR